ncbi:MAG: gliding motility-associated C-terminal domain-containing protein [Flavobacteriales bacterium]|nr:gliding motility-associated C-terminal domain-containing protein [Flavobacteriales bacterium]
MNWYKKIIVLIVICYLAPTVRGQTLYPMTPNSSVTITTCEGLFMDSGGSTSTYSANEVSTMTICASQVGASPIVTFNLTFFDIPTGDVLNVYDGPTNSSPWIGTFDNNLTTSSIQGSGTCITIEFISDGVTEGTGWQGSISCFIPCQDIISTISQSTPTIIMPGNEIHICKGDSLNLTGSGVYPENGTSYTQSDNLSIFEWDIDDDGLTDYTGANLDLLFTASQGNRINLVITDTNGCSNANLLDLFIMVSTPPSFNGLSLANDTICFSGSNSLTIDSVTSNPWYESYGNAVADTTNLPDDPGQTFSSTVSLSNFSAGQTLNSINDLYNICLNLEHSYIGDLEIEIVCPSGQSVFLLNNPNIAGDTFLGEPVDNDAPGYIQGDGYDYCFNNNPTYGTFNAEASAIPPPTYSYTDNSGVSVVNHAYLPAGSYQSENPLSGLLGCLLNGNWTIYITDNAQIDNGAIFSWYVDFNPAIFPTQLWGYDPGVASSNWVTDADVTGNYGDSIVVTPSNVSGGDVSYTYTMTDDFGCTYDTTLTFYVKPPSDPSCRICFPPIISITPNLCNGDSTGVIVLLANDSLEASPAPYTITWTDAALNIIAINIVDNLDSLTNIPAGSYFVQIEDNNNCIPTPAQTPLTITEPPILVTFMIGNLPTLCPNSCDGFAEVNNLGGTSPYTHSWPDGSTLPSSSGLCEGLNIATVTDANACVDTFPLTITAPPPITITLVGTDTLCQTETGYLAYNIEGGNGGYTSIWSTGSSNDTIYFSPTDETEYSLVVIDALGCTANTSDTVYVRDFISIDMIKIDTICNGDSTFIRAITIGGDGNYYYQWTNGKSSDDILTVAPVDDELYFVTVTDGCTTPIAIDSVTIIVGQYPVFVLYPPDIEEGCAPQVVEFYVDHIKPNRNYLWGFGDGTKSIINSKTVGHIYPDAGCYDLSLAVTTDLGCSRDTVVYCAVEIYPNPIAEFVLTNYKLTNLSPTTTMIDKSHIPDFWQWNFGDGETSENENVQHTYKDTGYYTITLAVETKNGCNDTTELMIHVDFESIIYTPNSFSPNGDGLNDFFSPKGEGINSDKYLLTIFSRWGEVIFQSSDVWSGWDGNLPEGTPAETGGYVYKIEYLRFGYLEQSVVLGPLTLIR